MKKIIVIIMIIVAIVGTCMVAIGLFMKENVNILVQDVDLDHAEIIKEYSVVNMTKDEILADVLNSSVITDMSIDSNGIVHYYGSDNSEIFVGCDTDGHLYLLREIES